MATKIEWTDATWNPSTGCTKVGPGCLNCYIERTPPFRIAGRTFVKGDIPIELHPDRLDKPLRWRKPRMVFVNSLSDLFHKDIPDHFIDRVFAVMALTPQHTYQVLTKRPERMADYLSDKPLTWWRDAVKSSTVDRRFFVAHAAAQFCEDGDSAFDSVHAKENWPLENVWLGTSVEDQKRADERIPHLLRVPAAVRFLSCEPLLGPLEISKWLRLIRWPDGSVSSYIHGSDGPRMISWVIVGGESGPKSRPCNVEWIRSIRDQCQAAGVPVFVKQLGANVRMTFDEWNDLTEGGIYGHDFKLDAPGVDRGVWRPPSSKGGEINEFPADLRVREFPQVPAHA